MLYFMQSLANFVDIIYFLRYFISYNAVLLFLELSDKNREAFDCLANSQSRLFHFRMIKISLIEK